MSSMGKHISDPGRENLWVLFYMVCLLVVIGLLTWAMWAENQTGKLVTSYTTRIEHVRKVFMYEEYQYGFLVESDGVLETKKLDCYGVKVIFKEDVPATKHMWIEKNYRSYSNPRFKEVLVKIIFHIHALKSDCDAAELRISPQKSRVLVFE